MFSAAGEIAIASPGLGLVLLRITGSLVPVLCIHIPTATSREREIEGGHRPDEMRFMASQIFHFIIKPLWTYTGVSIAVPNRHSVEDPE